MPLRADSAYRHRRAARRDARLRSITSRRLARVAALIALVLFQLTLRASAAVAVGPGSWAPAASMTVGRLAHTATLLPNGRVLVAAGGGGTASAELYDPASNTWTLAPSMHIGRSDPTATLLPDGRVLVAGGFYYRLFATASAELYEPETNTWTSAASMYTARGFHTATLLPDGRVLVTGGIDCTYSCSSADATAEIYDPRSDTWTPAASMRTARDEHTATLLLDGRVLVVGGANGYPGSSLLSAELYDPGTNSWTPAADMTYPTFSGAQHTATLLPNGRVLVTGGQPVPNDGVGSASAELYDPRANMWRPAADMTFPRARHTATLLPSGRVLVTGGLSGETGAATDARPAELYDPAEDTWVPAGTTSGERYGHTATLLVDGRVLVAGGFPSLTGAELYTPSPPAGDIGGRAATLTLGTDAARLHWIGGTVQTGYVIARFSMADGSLTVLPPHGALPATATNFVDSGLPTDAAYCYVMVALNGATAIGLSDPVCLVRGLRSTTGAPGDFALQLLAPYNSAPAPYYARLTWTAPGGQTGFRLLAIPLTGAPYRDQESIAPTATTTIDDTAGAPTCYLLIATKDLTPDKALGNTDMLCGIPGLATSPSVAAGVARRASDGGLSLDTALTLVRRAAGGLGGRDGLTRLRSAGTASLGRHAGLPDAPGTGR